MGTGVINGFIVGAGLDFGLVWLRVSGLKSPVNVPLVSIPNSSVSFPLSLSFQNCSSPNSYLSLACVTFFSVPHVSFLQLFYAAFLF